MSARTITMSLDARHSAVLDALAKEQCMTRSALMRQALRLYQLVHIHAKQGQQMAFRNTDGTYVQQIIIGLPALE